MARITTRLEGTEEIHRLLRDLKRAAGDLTPAFRSIGEALLNSTRARFTAQRDPGGAPWAPLDPKTKRRKKKNADKILTEEGELRGTLTYSAGASSLVVGSPEKYAATHQFGDASRNIPARPFLGLSAADRERVERIVRDRLAKALRG